MEPGPVAPAELDDFIRAIIAAFHDTLSDERLAEFRTEHALGRMLAVRDGGRIVATTAIEELELTLPGGPAPVAGVTMVGVLPTHRRRGLATALMRAQLDALGDGGEPIAALWASEGGIYGRFGFGPAAASARLLLRTDRTALRPGARPATVRTTLELDPAAAQPALRAVHDAARPDRIGMLVRRPGGWSRRLRDRAEDRGGARPLRAVLAHGPGGAPEGYALYAVRYDEQRDEHEAIVREVLAATPAAHLAVWDHLVGLDLVRSLRWDLAPADEPIAWALTDARAVEMRLEDSLWIRLVDVDRALEQRRYAREIDVVLDVEDDFCAHNAGRHRLSAGAGGAAVCAPTSDPADLRLDVAALASVFLGGPPLRALADAGRVEERTPGAVDAVTAAFRATREPWCPDIF